MSELVLETGQVETRAPVKFSAIGASLVVVLSAAYWTVRAAPVFAAEYGEFKNEPALTPAPETALTAGLTPVQFSLASGEEQHAFYLAGKNGKAVIFVHGSPGDGLSLLPEAQALHARGYSALLLDLPGYGRSQGVRNWDSTFNRAVSRGIDYLTAESSSNAVQIGAFGYSMGSCIVAQIAATDPRVRALVLLAPFTNLKDQLRYQFRSGTPGISAVPRLAAWLAGVNVERLNTSEALTVVRGRPVLFIAGMADPVVPFDMATELYTAQPPASAELWGIPGQGHVGFSRLGSVYFDRLTAFWDRALGGI